MTFNPKEVVKCELCNSMYNRCNKSRHYKTHHPETYGVHNTFQGVIREDHDFHETQIEKENEIKNEIEIKNENEEVDKAEVEKLKENVFEKIISTVLDNPLHNDKLYEKPQYKPIYQDKPIYQQKPIYQDKPFEIRVDSSNNINKIAKLEKAVIQLVDKVNNHTDDLYKLKVSNNTLVYDIKAVKEELTRQHRGVVRVSNEYMHGTDKNRKCKIRDLFKGGNTENSLKSLEIIITSLKSSIERTDERLNGLIERMNRLESEHLASNIKMNSIENDNKGIRQDIERHEKHLISLKIPTSKEIIDLMKDFLTKEGFVSNKESKDFESKGFESKGFETKRSIKRNIGNETPKIKETPEIKETVPLTINTQIINPANIQVTEANGVSEKFKANEKTEVSEKANEKMSGGFAEETKNWLKQVRLRNGGLTKKGLAELKNIFNKHASMGHKEEMTKYINKLPVNGNTKRKLAGTALREEMKNFIVK